MYTDHDEVLAGFLVPDVARHARTAGDEDAARDASADQRFLDSRPNGVHDTGRLSTEDVRQGYLLRERMVARPRGRVARGRDQDGAHAHPHLALARLGERDVLDLQYLRSSEGPHQHRLHQWSMCSKFMGPHLLAEEGSMGHTFGPCGNSSCQGRGSKWPFSSSKIWSISVKSSMMFPSGSRW